MIQVIALETGFDGSTIREPGALFEMPDDVFEQRPKLNEKGEPIKDQYYEPPHWFEPVDKAKRDEVEAHRKAARKGARGYVPAVDVARQQADAQADARILAAAQEAVRLERIAVDEAEINRRVAAKVAEMRTAGKVPPPKPETAKPPFKGTPVPSPDNLERSDHPAA